MNDWNIQSRAHVCQSCGKKFSEKENYHTLLFDDKKDLSRIDVCQACWETQYSQGGADRKGFISHWQGIYEPPPAAPPDAIQKDTAEDLLRKLIERNDPAHGPACFILAVMLERKRILRVKEQFRRDDRRYFIYEQPKTFDLFTIMDPNLQLDQLEEVQRDVGELLEHGVDGPPPAPADPPAATGSGSAIESGSEAVPAP